ncbi:partner of bursicon-like [Patiria miniata]|uniref:CTCK domain-containing protein n=1 Tax=Patiria miniata TaxID=46514 RepID=A0A913YXI9_PATMI|nr:partner of bursicon-like [Patiria miniata]
MQQCNRDNRGPLHHNTGLSLPFANGGPLVFLFFLLTMLHHNPEPSGRGLMATAALPQFCGLQTIRIEVEQSFQEGDTGVNRLHCRGNVTLTSCEGQCLSSVAPSVVTTAGFVKKCTCCQETQMQSTKIQLAHCVTDEGACLSDYVREVVVQEPSRCACQPCSP